MTTAKRVVIFLLFAISVFVVWAFISKTPWAATVDPLTAGKSFSHPIEPFQEIVGALLVAIPGVLLIRSGWSWFARVVLGREVSKRVPTRRTGELIR
jgi:small-conductance mechanosensitive channel